jgi:hypothetical protein
MSGRDNRDIKILQKKKGGPTGDREFKSPPDVEDVIEEAEEDGRKEGEDASEMSGETGERERRSSSDVGVPGRRWTWSPGDEGRRAGKKGVRQEMGVVWDRDKQT